MDIARAVARSYRAVLLDADPARCLALDNAARELGQHWIAPRATDAVDEGDLVDTATAAAYFGVDEATIRGWGSKKHVPVTRYRGGWRMEELLAYKAAQRRRRGHR